MQSLEEIAEEIKKAAAQAKRNPNDITLIAVSKTQSIEAMRVAIACKQKHFGENYVQEAIPKIIALKNAAMTWHYLGKIQSNKIKDLVKYFDYIHTVDSLKHAQTLSEICKAQNKVMPIFLQVNFENEVSKSGFSKIDVEQNLFAISQLPNLNLLGLMLIPSAKPKAAQQEVFKEFSDYRNHLSKTYNIALPELSMGMSEDFVEAITAGATYIRIGTRIFGARN